MFIGHAALGLASKRWAPRTSLAWLLTAPFLADLLWPVFLLLGWERVSIDPGNTPVTPLDFVSYPWSHSLLLLAVWSALFGALYGVFRRDRIGAWIVGLLVASHWVLDWVTHRPDMPLAPGGGPRLGLGLWYSKGATVTVEALMFATGLALYLGATRAKGWLGHVSLWSMVAFVLLAYFGALNGPPPPDEHTLALFSLIGFAFVPWAMWIEATRRNRAASGAA